MTPHQGLVPWGGKKNTRDFITLGWFQFGGFQRSHHEVDWSRRRGQCAVTRLGASVSRVGMPSTRKRVQIDAFEGDPEPAAGAQPVSDEDGSPELLHAPRRTSRRTSRAFRPRESLKSCGMLIYTEDGVSKRPVTPTSLLVCPHIALADSVE